MAYSTAVLAASRAEALAEDSEAMAEALRSGEVIPALDAFEASADRLQRFLTFLFIAAELLHVTGPEIGVRVVHYTQRLMTLLEKVEDALERQDLGRLGLVLAHGLSPALRDYEEHAEDVARALAPAIAA